MDWSELFARYAADPSAAWGEGQPLQARKLRERLAEKAGAGARDAAATIAGIVANARLRDGPPALFLVNCGSSGSHWIEAMLARASGIHACGEVYVAPSLHAPLAALDDRARACFMDALHQLHAEDPVRAVHAGDMLVNSAHSWNPHDLAGDSARAVLLVRDPLDVVLSRTFRKPKLRRHVAVDASDEQYLARNRDYVVRFMGSALRRRPAHVIRYEDAREDPARVLATVMAAAGRPFDAAMAGTLAEGDAGGGAGARGNLYRGPDTELPEGLVERLAAELAPLRARLGYGSH